MSPKRSALGKMSTKKQVPFLVTASLPNRKVEWGGGEGSQGRWGRGGHGGDGEMEEAFPQSTLTILFE